MIDNRSGKEARAVQGCLNGMLGLWQTENGEIGEEQGQEHSQHCF
jgi:hypothetical protein